MPSLALYSRPALEPIPHTPAACLFKAEPFKFGDSIEFCVLTVFRANSQLFLFAEKSFHFPRAALKLRLVKFD